MQFLYACNYVCLYVCRIQIFYHSIILQVTWVLTIEQVIVDDTALGNAMLRAMRRSYSERSGASASMCRR